MVMIHSDGTRVCDANEGGCEDELFECLEDLALNGPWIPAIRAALGSSAAVDGDEFSGYDVPYKYQAGIICSRPAHHTESGTQTVVILNSKYSREKAVLHQLCVCSYHW